ncbi:MAG: SulP family inorganic anion transporter [Rhodospirillales bacterium]
MSLRGLLPILDWARGYTRAALGADLVAATIVTIMLIPQSLAYAMLAGLPPHVGLYASMLPLVAYAVFGTSRTLAVGPVAVISLMTAAAIGEVAGQGLADPITAAVTLAALSGLVLLAMAALRLGFLANALSHPVISGFISASGILIAAGQVKHLLGVPGEGDTMVRIMAGLWNGLPATNLWTFAIGGAAALFLFWTRGRLKPALTRLGVPLRAADVATRAAPVVAVAASIRAVAVFDLGAAGVKVVGAVPAGLPSLTLPSLQPDLVVGLLPAAVLIALVGFVESVSVAQTLAARRRQRIAPNQELVGLGMANIASAVSGGQPVTGGFARSVVNFDAGAETPLAGAFTAVGIGVATLLLTPLFFHLPQATLAATIIVAVLSLVDLKAMKRTWRYSKTDFLAMATTIAGVLLAGVETGIVAGVALSLLQVLWRASRPHVAIVGQVPGTEHFRNVRRHDVIQSPRVLSVRVDESLWFANARWLEDLILDLAMARPGPAHVVLMCPAVNAIDASALESLEMIADRLDAAGIGFHLSEVKGPVMDALERSDFFEGHFRGQVFLSQQDAMWTLDPQTFPPPADRAGPVRAFGGGRSGGKPPHRGG